MQETFGVFVLHLFAFHDLNTMFHQPNHNHNLTQVIYHNRELFLTIIEFKTGREEEQTLTSDHIHGFV